MISQVEKRALERSKQKLIYRPIEKIGVIVVNSFTALGTLAALRFLEWVQQNPHGVISLPTGKTPEYFIKEVNRFLSGWTQKEIQQELIEGGVDPTQKCDLRGLHFVQIDEFYPISPLQHNSFHHYVTRFYLNGFGLDARKALLIDCSTIGLPRDKSLEEIWPEDEVDLSLRYRMGNNKLESLQKEVIEPIDQWCTDYETRIRKLGGIEIAKKRLVITIGLSTITYNPDCTAIIIAAGEAKAGIVAESIQNKTHIKYPATALQELKASRFYLTKGSAKLLTGRQQEIFVQSERISETQIEKTVIDLSLEKQKRIDLLTLDDFQSNPFSEALLKKVPEGVEEITGKVARGVKGKIEAGTRVRKDTVFLHTEPHHDDPMLGYLPFIVRHIREHSTRHYFATLTSGFTSVTNAFMLRQLKKLKKYIRSEACAELIDENYFDPEDFVFLNRDVCQYLDGVAADSRSLKDDGELRRLLRNMVDIYDEKDIKILKDRIDELINYFETQYPGKKDLDYIQKLKGMCREWEADCLWGYFGWNSESVRHPRLGFYKGDIFTEDPTLNRDVIPILNLLKEFQPNVVSLALDPEASGPDNHYKVLQAVTEALKIYEKESGVRDIEILGYRNVWYRFHPSEANLFVPVSLNMFSLQQSAFMNTSISQKEASLPSYEHDGAFSELAPKIQVEQYRMLKTCLGREYFYEHPSALIRATRGVAF